MRFFLKNMPVYKPRDRLHTLVDNACKYSGGRTDEPRSKVTGWRNSVAVFLLRNSRSSYICNSGIA